MDGMQEDLTGNAPGRTGRRREHVCTVCEEIFRYAFSCACGFAICQACFDENAWGMTCNHVTWECPDCGGMRSF